ADANSTACEDGVVEILDPGVGNLLVQRPALLVELAEVPLVAGERTLSAGAVPRGLHVDVDPQRDRVLPEKLARPLRLDGAAAQDDDRSIEPQGAGGRAFLDPAELGFAAVAED